MSSRSLFFFVTSLLCTNSFASAPSGGAGKMDIDDTDSLAAAVDNLAIGARRGQVPAGAGAGAGEITLDAQLAALADASPAKKSKDV